MIRIGKLELGFALVAALAATASAKAPPANRRLPQVQAFVPVLVDLGGAIRAGESELAANPRSRSAVLRVAEKLDGQGRRAA